MIHTLISYVPYLSHLLGSLSWINPSADVFVEDCAQAALDFLIGGGEEEQEQEST